MKLFKIWQEVNNDYDTYDSAVVAAENEEEARNIYPSYQNEYNEVENKESWNPESPHDDWVDNPKCVNVEYLGEAKPGTKKGQILASYSAG
jgi:hypothetical protein